MAHSLAIASEKITADMVEAIEFPQLANKYSVYGVPRSVINEKTHIEGAVPESLFVAKVQEALGMISAKEVERLMAGLVAEAEAPEHEQ